MSIRAVARDSALHHSPNAYDGDVAEQDSDSQDEVAEHDRSILKEEEEREKLLTEATSKLPRFPKFNTTRSDPPKPVKAGKKEKRRQQRRERRRARRRDKTDKGEDGELLSEMEEGALKDTGSDSSSLSDFSNGLRSSGAFTYNKPVSQSFLVRVRQ